jgi:hypothetical protein
MVFLENTRPLLPEPEPINGNAIDLNECFSANVTADRTDSEMEYAVAIQSIFIPATWIIPLYLNSPAEVIRA